MKRDFSRVRLCVLVSGERGGIDLERLVAEAVAGGADCIQLREKGIGDGELLERARVCRRMCGEAIFIVNDRADIAVLSGADGVHVGQEDLSVVEARRIVGEGALVGVSTSNLAQLEAAERKGADYLGVGCVFATGTKETEVTGLEYVKRASAAARIPFLAIGGITAGNVGEVIGAGAPGVAVSSAVAGAADPRAAARELREAIERAHEY